MIVREANPQDCREAEGLMKLVIEEIYVNESEEVRRALCANFTGEALQELCADEHRLTFVAEEDGKIVAMIFGWLFLSAFTIYWIYCLPEYRGKGLVRTLLRYAEEELVKKDCYKLQMYAYAEHNRFLDFCAHLGFRKGVLLEKTMFGFKIQKIFKYIGEGERAVRERKIKILGEAGQGIKLLALTLASILAQLGNEVSLNLEYDSAVRSGKISADLIYSDHLIENPIIDEADVLIKFTRDREWFPAKSLVIDESFCEKEDLTCTIKNEKGTLYGFENVALSVFGSKIYINMIALGRILRYIGINILLLNIKDLLPQKYVEKNLEAIKYGFRYRDDV
jgi:2-oxoglutarate ferredoxin oxidoreductase subunit gamma